MACAGKGSSAVKSVSFVSWHAIVDGMDFQLEFGFYSYASNAAFWCFVSDLSATKTRSHLLKLPSAVPLDLLILRIFLVALCIFSVLFYAGIARAPPASVGCVFLRIVLLDFLGSSLSFQCRTLRFPKNRTRAFLLVVARCAASYLWKSLNEAFDVIGKRSVYGMDFQLEFGFYSTPALPRSVCCPVVALQQNPELLLKL